MKPFTTLTGTAAPLPLANIDTDMIIPKQFLKTVSREGLAKGLFYELKTKPDGSPNPDFVLNRPAYAKASILIAKENFGCGSSREHAPWALEEYGFRAVIAPSFADIFYNNSFKNGLLPIVLAAHDVDTLFAQCEATEGYALTVDLATQTVTRPDGVSHSFEVDEFRKHCLLHGLDDIGLKLQHADAISAFEARHRAAQPWVFARG